MKTRVKERMLIEKACIKVSIKRNSSSYTELYNIINGRLRFYISRLLKEQRDSEIVENIIHDTFIQLTEAINSEKEIEDYSFWIFAVAKFKSAQHIRKITRKKAKELNERRLNDDIDPMAPIADDVSTSLQKYRKLTGNPNATPEDAFRTISELVKKLPKKTRYATENFYINGIRHSETAKISGIKASTLMSTARNGKEMILKML